MVHSNRPLPLPRRCKPIIRNDDPVRRYLTYAIQNLFHGCVRSVYRPVLGPTQPPIQWAPGALFRVVKHLVPRSIMRGAIPPPPIRRHGVVLS